MDSRRSYLIFCGIFIAYLSTTVVCIDLHGCDGEDLQLSCPQAGHVINVISDFYGAHEDSGETACRYSKGDCIQASKQHSSRVRRQCNGKVTCSVPLRTDAIKCPDGQQTTYFQVEYECLPGSVLQDVCTSSAELQQSGYLVTPGYPYGFPPGLDCMCFLMAPQEGAIVTLSSLNFGLSSSKCSSGSSRLVVKTDREVTSHLCAPTNAAFEAKVVAINLLTTSRQQARGFLLHYAVDSGKTALLCGTRASLGVLDRDLGGSFAPLLAGGGAGGRGAYGVAAFWNTLGANVTKAGVGVGVGGKSQGVGVGKKPQGMGRAEQRPQSVPSAYRGKPVSVSGCAGSELQLLCPGGHIINVLEDLHGYSSISSCQHFHSDRCIIKVPSNESIPTQMCNGKQECTYKFLESYTKQCPMSVGVKTTYQQISYDCVRVLNIHSVCSSATWGAPLTYLSSPGYPPLYPSGLDCPCTLTPSSPGALVMLTTEEFALVDRKPCADFLSVRIDDGPTTTMCGFRVWSVMGKRIRLHFHTVYRGFKGFLLRATVTFGKVNVHCGPGALESPSSSSQAWTTKPPRPQLRQLVPPTRLPPVRLTDAKNGPGNPMTDSNRPFGGSDSFRVDDRQSAPGSFNFRDPQREGGFRVPDRAPQDPRMAVLRPTPAGPIGPILAQTPDSPLRPVTPPTPRRPLGPTLVPEENVLRLSFRSDPFRQKAMDGAKMGPAMQTSNKEVSACHGETLELLCPGTSMVNVLGDFQGMSVVQGRCQYSPADQCVLPSLRGASKLRDACNGQTMCDFKVSERRTCKTKGYTTYAQAKYECVHKSHVYDICRTGTWTVNEPGYLVSPNYPNFFPAPRSCSCSLGAQGNVISVQPQEIRVGVGCPRIVRLSAGDRPVPDLCVQRQASYNASAFHLQFTTARPGRKGILIKFQALAGGPVQLTCRSQATVAPANVSAVPPGTRPLGMLAPPRLEPPVAEIQAVAEPEGSVVAACFGDLISFQCRANEVIRIIDDFYGMTPGVPSTTCRHRPDDCVLRVKGSTSSMDEFCSGRMTCQNRIVPRMFCNGAVTTYQQVTYECVPKLNIQSVTSPSTEIIQSGYLSSPNYPSLYPANTQAYCTLAAEKQHNVQLVVSHLLLAGGKSRCSDSLLVQFDKTKKKFCGTGYGIFEGAFIKIIFKTDHEKENMGFLLRFKGLGGSTVRKKCRPGLPPKKLEKQAQLGSPTDARNITVNDPETTQPAPIRDFPAPIRNRNARIRTIQAPNVRNAAPDGRNSAPILRRLDTAQPAPIRDPPAPIRNPPAPIPRQTPSTDKAQPEAKEASNLQPDESRYDYYYDFAEGYDYDDYGDADYDYDRYEDFDYNDMDILDLSKETLSKEMEPRAKELDSSVGFKPFEGDGTKKVVPLEAFSYYSKPEEVDLSLSKPPSVSNAKLESKFPGAGVIIPAQDANVAPDQNSALNQRSENSTQTLNIQNPDPANVDNGNTNANTNPDKVNPNNGNANVNTKPETVNLNPTYTYPSAKNGPKNLENYNPVYIYPTGSPEEVPDSRFEDFSTPASTFPKPQNSLESQSYYEAEKEFKQEVEGTTIHGGDQFIDALIGNRKSVAATTLPPLSREAKFEDADTVLDFSSFFIDTDPTKDKEVSSYPNPNPPEMSPSFGNEPLQDIQPYPDSQENPKAPSYLKPGQSKEQAFKEWYQIADLNGPDGNSPLYPNPEKNGPSSETGYEKLNSDDYEAHLHKNTAGKLLPNDNFPNYDFPQPNVESPGYSQDYMDFDVAQPSDTFRHSVDQPTNPEVESPYPEALPMDYSDMYDGEVGSDYNPNPDIAKAFDTVDTPKDTVIVESDLNAGMKYGDGNEVALNELSNNPIVMDLEPGSDTKVAAPLNMQEQMLILGIINNTDMSDPYALEESRKEASNTAGESANLDASSANAIAGSDNAEKSPVNPIVEIFDKSTTERPDLPEFLASTKRELMPSTTESSMEKTTTFYYRKRRPFIRKLANEPAGINVRGRASTLHRMEGFHKVVFGVICCYILQSTLLH